MSPHVILLGNEEGTAEVAEEFGAAHIPDVRCSNLGTPLASDVFGKAERMATGKLMLFTNADMIYAQSMASGLRHVAAKLDRFLVLGQRWDLDIDTELDFTGGGAELNRLVKAHGQKHSPSGMDYMGFSKHLWGPLPDFVLGRAAWDGAMLSRTLHAKIPVVDATSYIIAVHQNHDYAHMNGGWQEVWGGEEAQQNKDLAEPLPWIIDIWYSTHVLELTGIVSKKSYVPSLPSRSVNDPGVFVGQPGTPQPQIVTPRPIPQPVRLTRRSLVARRSARPPSPPVPPPVAKPITPEPIAPIVKILSQASEPVVTPVEAEPPAEMAPEPVVCKVRAEKDLEMTIFTCPKPFVPPFDVIQYNAIMSWTLFFPRPEIILVGDEKGTAEIAKELSIRHIPEVDKSPSGAPLADSVFGSVLDEGHGLLSVFINADVIATQSLWDVAARVYSSLESDFLIMGRRWALDVSAPISFTRGGWWRELRRQCQSSGRLDHPDALDYFIFTYDLYEDLPSLTIGRAAIDGALVALALKKGVPVVDATDTIFVVHQNHDYSHLPGGKDDVWNGPDAQKNRELVPDWAKTIAHATHKMTAGGLFKKS